MKQDPTSPVSVINIVACSKRFSDRNHASDAIVGQGLLVVATSPTPLHLEFMAHADIIVFARELAGLARTELASRIGLSVHQLRALETGQAQPSDTVLQTIALSAGLSVDFFHAMPPSLQLATDGSHFRARKSVSQRHRLLAVRLGAVLGSFHAACEDREVIFPEDRLSDFIDSVAERFPRPEDLRVEDIESLAVELRRHWGLGIGALPNVIQLLEARGVAVFELGGAVEKSVDAFSARIRAGRPAIFIGVNDHASRRRFTVAHELGHLVLHHTPGDLEPGHSLLEEQANRFAGAFLMPAASYASTARSHTHPRALADLKPVWRSSVAAMVTRSYQLGLLSFEQRAAAYRFISGVWSKAGEPHEPPLERPIALGRAIALLGLEAADVLAQAAGLSAAYVEELASVAKLATKRSAVTEVAR